MNAIVDPVAAAVAAAQAAAKTLAEVQAQAVTVQAPAANSNLPAAVAPGRPLTMDDMQGGLTVDHWLGVKEFGFVLGAAKTLHAAPILVELNMAMIQPNFTVKFGNPAIYLRTYDHVTEVRGGSWQDAIRRAQSVDSRASEYRSVDIPMKLLHDIPGVAEKGQTLGYSTPTTGWAPWQAFYADCLKHGLQHSIVECELGWMKRTNKNGNVWGIVTYTLKHAAAAQAA